MKFATLFKSDNLACFLSVALVVASEVSAQDSLVAPFEPPTLEQINANAKWVPQRVVDPMELLRQQQAKEKPLVTVAEALRLKNDSANANARILSALGRLPEATSKVDYESTIIRRVKGDVKSTVPILASSIEEFDAASLTSIGFFGFDWTMQPFALADTVKSWETSADGLYDKLVIRNDLTWSDGRPITAHDIVFSFFTIMNPKVPVPAQRSGTDQLRWVHAYDDHTVVYFHKESRPTNIWNVNFSIIPKHVYEKSVKEDPSLTTSPYHIERDEKPVCGGPYKLTRRDRQQELVFTRRDDYFTFQGKQVRNLEHFREIRIKVVPDSNTAILALTSGQIEEMELDAEQWRTNLTNSDEFYARNTKSTGTEWVEFHVNWNCSTPFFSDKRTRKAMSYAIDHEELLTKLFYGLYEPASGPFHHTSWMAPKKRLPLYKQDLDKAEELLDQAGWKLNDNTGFREKRIDGRPVKFEFTLLCTTTPVSRKVSELIQGSINKIGIVCHVKPTEPTVLQQTLLDHKFQAAFGGWGTGTDPDTSINIFSTTGDRNYGKYSNAEVDKLYEQGRREFDKEKRAAIYAKIHEIMYDDQPYTWLYYRNSFYGFNKSLRGYRFSPRGPYHYNPGFSSIWKSLNP